MVYAFQNLHTPWVVPIVQGGFFPFSYFENIPQEPRLPTAVNLTLFAMGISLEQVSLLAAGCDLSYHTSGYSDIPPKGVGGSGQLLQVVKPPFNFLHADKLMSITVRERGSPGCWAAHRRVASRHTRDSHGALLLERTNVVRDDVVHG
jgi:hypothetical protein